MFTVNLQIISCICYLCEAQAFVNFPAKYFMFREILIHQCFRKVLFTFVDNCRDVTFIFIQIKLQKSCLTLSTLLFNALGRNCRQILKIRCQMFMLKSAF